MNLHIYIYIFFTEIFIVLGSVILVVTLSCQVNDVNIRYCSSLMGKKSVIYQCTGQRSYVETFPYYTDCLYTLRLNLCLEPCLDNTHRVQFRRVWKRYIIVILIP